MKDYSKGKVYAIRSHQTEMFYIGSTINSLTKRLSSHIADYKIWTRDNKGKWVSSYEVLKYDDHYIELVENYPCADKNELQKREGELIRKYNKNCVNRLIPKRTIKEWCEDHKEELAAKKKTYRAEHKHAIKARDANYYKNNADKIKVHRAEYYENNKDEQKATMRDYYKKNKDKWIIDEYKAHRTEKIACPLCNSMVSRGNIATHNKSIKCKTLQTE